MRVGIIGSGNIGGNLGIHLAGAGYEILFSSRHPAELKALAKEAGKNATTGTIEEASALGDVIVLSVPFWAVEEVAGKIGPQSGKMIIETVNPYPQRDGQMAQKVCDSSRAASVCVVVYCPAG